MAVVKKRRFFEISSPGKDPILVYSKSGWLGLITLADKVCEPKTTFIKPITLWKFIKYIIKRGKRHGISASQDS